MCVTFSKYLSDVFDLTLWNNSETLSPCTLAKMAFLFILMGLLSAQVSFRKVLAVFTHTSVKTAIVAARVTKKYLKYKKFTKNNIVISHVDLGAHSVDPSSTKSHYEGQWLGVLKHGTLTLPPIAQFNLLVKIVIHVYMS